MVNKKRIKVYVVKVGRTTANFRTKKGALEQIKFIKKHKPKAKITLIEKTLQEV